MASISVPCPKCSVVSLHNGSRLQNQNQQQKLMVSFSPSSRPSPSLQLQEPGWNPRTILKAQTNEVIIESSSNSMPKSSTKLETRSSDDNDSGQAKEITPQASVISAFMTEVADLVMLVDSKDIMELRLKQTDCEIIIKKKEAFMQSPPTNHVVMMQSPSPQAMLPPPLPFPHAFPPPAPSAPAPSSPALALPSPAKTSKSSLPPLKCPMAGTFYRFPAPGEPPFVKIGDKVQKGQVVCIIEAMKLMNEIEADQSGTVVEIIAEDGKPVSVDVPLLVIQP